MDRTLSLPAGPAIGTENSLSLIANVCRLLEVPREVRHAIMQYLLRSPDPVAATEKPGGLHPQILRVNKQLSAEGLEILYGENYFRMAIMPGFVSSCALFLRCDDFGEEIAYGLQRFHLIQHYAIDVDMGRRGPHFLKPAIQKAAELLADVPRLKHLQITLREQVAVRDRPPPRKVHTWTTLLEPFTLLRGVHRVDLTGDVSVAYAHRLKEIMEGRTPRDHLPKMYRALRAFAEKHRGFQDLMLDAWVAADDSNAPAFKRIRADVITRFVNRSKDEVDQLFEHDAAWVKRLGWSWALEQRPSLEPRRSLEPRPSLGLQLSFEPRPSFEPQPSFEPRPTLEPRRSRKRAKPESPTQESASQ